MCRWKHEHCLVRPQSAPAILTWPSEKTQCGDLNANHSVFLDLTISILFNCNVHIVFGTVILYMFFFSQDADTQTTLVV